MTSESRTDKPFRIEKRRVYEAYKAVKSNAGSAGVDGQTIGQFDADLRNNLYKLWNRMTSADGSHGADQGSAPAYGGMDRCRLHLSQSLQNWWHTSHQVIRCAAAFLVVWPPPVSSRLRRWRSRELMPSSVTAIMVL